MGTVTKADRNTIGKDVRMDVVQPLWKTIWQFHKTLKIELPYGSAIPLVGIYPKELKAGSRDICMPMFMAALFTVAKR